MKCYLCGKQASIKVHNNRFICDNCFVWLFEKRIRKATRLDETFKTGDRVLVLGEVANYLTKSITKDMRVTVFSRNKINNDFIKKQRINKIVAEDTLDDELNQFVKCMFKGKKPKTKNKYIKILKNVTDNEVILFARIKSLKFKPNKKDKSVQQFLDNVQKRYPNAKYTLLKNISELSKLK